MGCAPVNRRTGQKNNLIVITGAKGSGKSVFFFQLTGHPQITKPIPTYGVSSEIVQHNDKMVTVVELGEQSPDSMVELQYLSAAKGIVFTIDGQDRSGLTAASIKFQQIADKYPVPILICLTKSDKTSLTWQEVNQHLGLRHLVQPNKVLTSQGFTGEETLEGFIWLFETIFNKK